MIRPLHNEPISIEEFKAKVEEIAPGTRDISQSRIWTLCGELAREGASGSVSAMIGGRIVEITLKPDAEDLPLTVKHRSI